MQNTYLYIRFSDDKQAQGSSHARQLQYAKDYCSTLIEDKEHIFFDSGKSAFSGANLARGGELKRFYDSVASGLIPKGSTLLVEDLDRLSRDGMWKASDKLRELTENGIAVVTLRDRKRYEGVLKISDALTSLIKQELAHEESAKKSSRVAQSYVKRYAAARAGYKVKVLLPGWIEWASPTAYRLKDAEAATVQKMFKMAAVGHSYAVIARALNEEGIVPFRSRGKNTLWITATIFGIIKGKAAIGTYAPRDGGPPIEGYFPAVVTKEEYDAAQGARAERKTDNVTRTSAKFNLWSKVGLCGVCGRMLHCLPKGRDGKQYLVCSGKIGFNCKALNVNAERAELAFLELLVNVVNSDYFTSDSKQVMAEIRQLSGQIADQTEKKSKLVALLEADPLPEVVAAIKKTNGTLSELGAKQAELELQVMQAAKAASSKAALMAKIDLESTEARMEANALLRRLSIKTEILRAGEQINYIVRQDGNQVLAVYDRQDSIFAISYSEETAERMYKRGETPEMEYFVSLDDFVE